LEKLFQLSLNGLMAGAVLAGARHRFDDDLRGAALREFLGRGAHGGRSLCGLHAATSGSACRRGSRSSAPLSGAGMVGIASDHIGLRPLRGQSALTLAIASIAVNLMIESAIRFFFGGSPRDYAIPLRRDWHFGFLHVGPQQVENFIIAASRWALLFLFLALTLTGKAMRAVADNPMLADSKGIDPDRMARLAIGIGMGSPASAACWSGSTHRSIRWSAFARSCRCLPPRCRRARQRARRGGRGNCRSGSPRSCRCCAGADLQGRGRIPGDPGDPAAAARRAARGTRNMTSYLIAMATFAAIYAILALGLNVMWGMAGWSISGSSASTASAPTSRRCSR
jgi:hypothetical protein